MTKFHIATLPAALPAALSAALLATLLSACLTSSDTDADTTSESNTGKDKEIKESEQIAPECPEPFCAQIDVNAKLQCHDAVSNRDFSMSTRLSGLTTEVTCDAEDQEGGGQDLRIGVRPASISEEDTSEVWLRIRGFTGPGTYPLFQASDEDSHQGFELTGNATSPEKSQTVGTLNCLPSPCEAIVAPETEPVPNDSMTAKEWRVRLKVRCSADGKLSNMQCDPPARTMCTFTEAPTLRFDVACRK